MIVYSKILLVHKFTNEWCTICLPRRTITSNRSEVSFFVAKLFLLYLIHFFCLFATFLRVDLNYCLFFQISQREKYANTRLCFFNFHFFFWLTKYNLKLRKSSTRDCCLIFLHWKHAIFLLFLKFFLCFIPVQNNTKWNETSLHRNERKKSCPKLSE